VAGGGPAHQGSGVVMLWTLDEARAAVAASAAAILDHAQCDLAARAYLVWGAGDMEGLSPADEGAESSPPLGARRPEPGGPSRSSRASAPPPASTTAMGTPTSTMRLAGASAGPSPLEPAARPPRRAAPWSGPRSPGPVALPHPRPAQGPGNLRHGPRGPRVVGGAAFGTTAPSTGWPPTVLSFPLSRHPGKITRGPGQHPLRSPNHDGTSE
jgi:hypothetical protein